ncbi:ABC transporter permease [Haliscomenobacter sp.]|uniref:ABC transporter permease n=1 Tax=Haliscomenobacter sp. TaxID=2717303 RepID=UPI003592F7FD
MKKVILAVLFALFILPFGYLVLLSVASSWRFPEVFPSQNLSLIHWASLSRTGVDWLSSLATSALVAGVVGCLSTTAGFLSSHVLSIHSSRKLWITLAYFPYAFSPVIYAYCLSFMFNVLDLTGTLGGVLIAQFILTYPFAVLFFFNHFDQQLREMEALARTLGSSTTVVFWKILLPISKHTLLICFFQVFLISWFDYGLTSVIGLGQVKTLSIMVYQYIGEANIHVAAIAACLLSFPPLVLLWFNHQFVFKKV